MTIQEAINQVQANGGTLKRPNHIEPMRIDGDEIEFGELRTIYKIGIADILATDWEVKPTSEGK